VKIAMDGPRLIREDHENTKITKILVQRSRKSSCIEGGDAPAMRGATTEHTGQYVREEQRRSAGCSAGRMPSYFAIAALVLLCQIDEFPNGFGSDHF